MLKGINAEKASGFDKIPPKMVKLAARVLAAPLSKTINNSISKGIFPNEAKCLLLRKRQTKILFETTGRLVYYLLSLNYLVRLMKII